jgi:Fe-S cluster assembly ATP-binding protein
MGDSRYSVTTNQQTNKPTILFQGKDLLEMSVDERVRAGLYVAWQSPVTIPGVSVFSLCKASYETQGQKLHELVGFKNKLEELAITVGLPKEYIGRNVNEGFSGGERKRLELLQLLLLNPKLVILDEIDSGLDVDGLKMVADVVNKMRATGTTFILITHYKRLLDYVKVDKICVMKDGRITKVGGNELIDEIEERGYGKLPTRI